MIKFQAVDARFQPVFVEPENGCFAGITRVLSGYDFKKNPAALGIIDGKFRESSVGLQFLNDRLDGFCQGLSAAAPTDFWHSRLEKGDIDIGDRRVKGELQSLRYG